MHGYGNEKSFYFIDINECHSDPCMNEGTCQDGVFQYTCSCADGYTGTHCETGSFWFNTYIMPFILRKLHHFY